MIVGGNGERVTAGYAIRFGDELNYVFLDAKEIARRMVAVRARCEQEGRDPGSLRFSLGHSSTQADVDALGAVIGEAVDRARRAAR